MVETIPRKTPYFHAGFSWKQGKRPFFSLARKLHNTVRKFGNSIKRNTNRGDLLWTPEAIFVDTGWCINV